MTKKFFLYMFFIALGYFLVFKFTYKALENEHVYGSLFSSFVSTYENQNGVISVVKKPFTEINDAAYATMDAAHYSYIRSHWYDINPNDEETKYNFAFFPLFPVVWKFFSGLGIITVNYFLYFASILILAFTFCRKSIIAAVIVALALPTLTVFLLPYTEALFMFSISIALLGYKEKKKNLYITGLLLASITRPVFLLFICALIAAEVFQFLQKKKTERGSTLIAIFVMLSGTFAVAMFQHIFFNVPFFTFISSQEHWGTFFRIPETINDWSTEGYGMNVGALMFCFVFGTASLVSALIKKQKEETNDFDFWYYFSWIFLMATCVYVLLFQGGCLHSLYRYTLCSPFFYVILFQNINKIENLSIKSSLVLLILFLVSCFFFLDLVIYAKQWDFSKTGFVLLTSNLLFFILSFRLNNRFKFLIYAFLILCGVFWNCYLYNMFFSRAWIFL